MKANKKGRKVQKRKGQGKKEKRDQHKGKKDTAGTRA